MKRDPWFLKILIVASFVFIIQHTRAQITATQMGMYDFKIGQNLTPSDMDGTNDVTAKLQAAVYAARDAMQTLFIPSGTYKISSQISCELSTSAADGRPNIPVNIVGSAVKHPLFVLTDNLTEFNGTIPRAVFHLKFNDVRYGTDWFMQGGIRGIDIDLGNANYKAVGIFWSCAQHCYIEDIIINARSGFAGITGIGGANSLLANLTVIGGKHGIYLPEYNEAINFGMKNAPQNTMTGCTFTDQTDIPMVIYGWGGITVVGTTIKTASSTAIKLRCDGSVNVFPFSLVDSRIEFSVPSINNTVISNLKNGYVSLRGLYSKGAGKICDNNSDENLMNAGLFSDWTHIIRYNYVSKSSKKDNKNATTLIAKHFDGLLGVQSTVAISQKENVAEPPADLTSQHIWSSTPSFEDENAILVTTASEIQPAINSGKTVCLAKGDYVLTSPITLKSSTVLVGCPGIGTCGSKLTYGWKPTKLTWLIETENSASATTYLFDIYTDPGNDNYLGSLHWQAGKNSVIRNVWFDKSWDSYEKDLIRMYFSGNGGGRIFNYQDEKGGNPSSAAHRKIKIEGTTQQLTFYGLNLERGGNKYPESSFPMLEIETSSNIRIFGAKTETYQPYASVNNSHNIFMTNIIDFAHFGPMYKNYIEITGSGSDSIEITNCMWIASPDANYFVVSDPWNTNEIPRTMVLGCYHRNWSTISGSATASVGIFNRYPNPQFSLYPTAVKNNITIESSASQMENNKASICNMSGQIVRDFQITSNKQQISLEDIPSGLYIFRMLNLSQKILKLE